MRIKTTQVYHFVPMLLGIGIFAHWPSLISDSLMWDDYNVLPWITQSRWDWAFQFLHNYGVTPYLIAYAPFFLLKNNIEIIVWFAKILTLAGIILNGYLIIQLTLDITRGNRIFAWISGFAAICSPSTSGEGFHLSSIVYYLFIPLFYIGLRLWIFLITHENAENFENIESSEGYTKLWFKKRWVIRFAALSALFLSFSFNSLLVFFYGLLPAVIYAALETQSLNFSNVKSQLLHLITKYSDFLLLPLVFWFVKQIFMPRAGLYTRYNSLIFDWPGIGESFKRLIPDVLNIHIHNPFSISYLLLFSCMLILIGIVLPRLSAKFNTIIKEAISTINRSQWITMLLLAVFALACAALPYYLVGRRSFEAYGFMSRDNILFALPMAWMTAAIFGILYQGYLSLQKAGFNTISLAWQRFVFWSLIAVLLSQSVTNWRNQADWQAHYAYYRSVGLKLSKEPLVQNASVLQIIDRLPKDRTLKSFNYPTSVWSGILTARFNKSNRLALPELKAKRRYSAVEIKKRRVETEIDFMFEDVNVLGRQVRVIVEPAYSKDAVSLAITYWQTRFFSPNNMNKWLASLTTIKIQPL